MLVNSRGNFPSDVFPPVIDFTSSTRRVLWHLSFWKWPVFRPHLGTLFVGAVISRRFSVFFFFFYLGLCRFGVQKKKKYFRYGPGPQRSTWLGAGTIGIMHSMDIEADESKCCFVYSIISTLCTSYKSEPSWKNILKVVTNIVYLPGLPTW